MAYKVFSNGNTLPASDLNTYLMNQSVMTFATSTARSAALTAPTEGMLTWLEDSDKYQYYSGTAWVDFIPGSSYDQAGKNKIINGAFEIWQRGTSFSATPGYQGYGMADRWRIYNGVGSSTCLTSQQTFTAGTAPVTGYEGQYFQRIALSGFTSGNVDISNRIENVRTLAGQTATLSFWVKADTTRTVTMFLEQNFGTGGSSSNYPLAGSTISATTSWQRFTFTVTMNALTSATIGADSYLAVIFRLTSNATLDIWGVQLEAGSVATPFSRNASSIQAELAACQRYYQRFISTALFGPYSTFGVASSATAAGISLQMPTTMRTTPTSLDFSTLRVTDGYSFASAVSAITISEAGPTVVSVACTSSGLTSGRAYRLENNNSISGYIGFSAEL